MAELAPGPVRTRGMLLLGVVFVLGMICGAALFFTGQRSIGPHPPGPRPVDPLERLSIELDLDDDQRQAIRTIMDEQRTRLHRVLEDSRQEIRALLRPEQQRRFDRMRPPRPGEPGGPPVAPPGGHLPPDPPPPPGGHPPPDHPPPPGHPPPG